MFQILTYIEYLDLRIMYLRISTDCVNIWCRYVDFRGPRYADLYVLFSRIDFFLFSLLFSLIKVGVVGFLILSCL